MVKGQKRGVLLRVLCGFFEGRGVHVPMNICSWANEHMFKCQWTYVRGLMNICSRANEHMFVGRWTYVRFLRPFLRLKNHILITSKDAERTEVAMRDGTVGHTSREIQKKPKKPLVVLQGSLAGASLWIVIGHFRPVKAYNNHIFSNL